MVRILLIGIIPVAITLGIIFFLARPNLTDLKKGVSDNVGDKLTSSLIGSNSETSFPKEITDEGPLTKKELLRILEASISALDAKVDTLARKQGISPQILLPTASSAPVSTTAGPKVAYIPLGSSGSSTSIDSYENITSTEIEIDTGSYPGYKNMYLEAQIRIFQGNGTGFARVFNKTDGLIMLGSEVSTTSETFSLKTSGAFRLTNGKKTYLAQLKSTTGYSVDLQTTRIRVEF